MGRASSTNVTPNVFKSLKIPDSNAYGPTATTVRVRAERKSGSIAVANRASHGHGHSAFTPPAPNKKMAETEYPPPWPSSLPPHGCQRMWPVPIRLFWARPFARRIVISSPDSGPMQHAKTPSLSSTSSSWVSRSGSLQSRRHSPGAGVERKTDRPPNRRQWYVEDERIAIRDELSTREPS